jgi:hypothetical protein
VRIFIAVAILMGRRARLRAITHALMSRSKKRKKPAKKRTVRKRIALIKEKLETQRFRAARPVLPVNTQANVSETLAERKKKLERKRAQRKDWENI